MKNDIFNHIGWLLHMFIKKDVCFEWKSTKENRSSEMKREKDLEKREEYKIKKQTNHNFLKP